MKKQKKLPDPQALGFIPTNSSETKYYPFGGLINQGVTGIAKALGANDKNAQLIGSGVSTLTGFIPGMQDNFLQAGDMINDATAFSKNKDIQNIGKTASALSPLLSLAMPTQMANGGYLSPEQRLLRKYPGMSTVYGEKGENLNIIKDKNYNAASHGFGDIEFMFPNQNKVTYSDDYSYANPTPDKYTSVRNKNKNANLGDVYLDLLHGMADDPEYNKLRDTFVEASLKEREGDIKHFYDKALKENPYQVGDGYDAFKNNMIDGYLRAELSSKDKLGKKAKGNKDYELERKYSSDEMKVAANNIYSYLKTSKMANGGYLTKELGLENIPATMGNKKLKALGGNINPPTPEEFLGDQNPYYTTKRDLSSMKAVGYDPKTTLVKHIDDKNINFELVKTEADKLAAIQKAEQQAWYNNMVKQYGTPKVITPKGATTIKKAMGGELTQFEGSTHEEGGVPLGNSNVEVEDGETKHENYIFSDRIKLPWNKKSSFSDESKRIEKKYKDLATDPLAQKSKKSEMDKLKDAQEVVKGDMIKKAQKIMQTAGMHQMPDGSMMQNNQMAYGGKMYYYDGGVHDFYSTAQSMNNAANNTIANNPYGIPVVPNEEPSNSKNYSPEEQQLMMAYSNELNRGNMTQAQYEEAIAQLGTGNAVANALQNARQGSFNDQLRWDEKAMPFLPVLGQAATLIGGVDKTQYHQAKANLVDLKPQRTAAEKTAAIARLVGNQNIRNIAGNSGRGLTNIVTSNAAIQDNLSDQLSQSYLNEANTNAQILNQTDMFNTQIKNEQVNANEMNKARFQETFVNTLKGFADTYAGVSKDQRAYKSQNNFNTMAAENLGTNNYGFYIDENGTVRIKFKVDNSI